MRVAPDTTRADLVGAIAVVNRSLQPCPVSMAIANVARITAGCQRPERIEGGDDADLYAGLIVEVFMAFPVDIVEVVSGRWLETRRYWPTTSEIREALTEEMNARTALREELQAQVAALDDGTVSGHKGLSPRGKTVTFVEAVRRASGDSYVRGYLAGGVMAVFTDDAVYVAPGAARVLNDEHWKLIKEHGVRVVACWECQKMLERYCGSRESEPAPKKRRA